MTVTHLHSNIDDWSERVDLAAAFRWTARLKPWQIIFPSPSTTPARAF